MVRGLKEDNSLLPVAFMDMNMYVSVAKSLDSMVLFGDFMKGISFVGFSVSHPFHSLALSFNKPRRKNPIR
jgi:hypothetical protein